MKSWIKLSDTGLAASLLLACDGSGGTDEGSVTPLSQLQPGERFSMETPLLAGGSQKSLTWDYASNPPKIAIGFHLSRVATEF